MGSGERCHFAGRVLSAVANARHHRPPQVPRAGPGPAGRGVSGMGERARVVGLYWFVADSRLYYSRLFVVHYQRRIISRLFEDGRRWGPRQAVVHAERPYNWR